MNLLTFSKRQQIREPDHKDWQLKSFYWLMIIFSDLEHIVTLLEDITMTLLLHNSFVISEWESSVLKGIWLFHSPW